MRLVRAVEATVGEEVAVLLAESELIEWKQTSCEDGTLQLTVTVRSSEQYPHERVLAFQREVATRIQRPVALLLNVIPATRLDPLAPPTFTPMPTPTPTAIPGPVAAASVTSSPTVTPQPTATAIAAATATATHTPTATPRPTPGFAVIANAGTRGANLRAAPDGAVICAVTEGTLVILLGDRVEADGRAWVYVMVAGRPNGRIAEDYLSVIAAPP